MSPREVRSIVVVVAVYVAIAGGIGQMIDALATPPGPVASAAALVVMLGGYLTAAWCLDRSRSGGDG